MSSQKLAVPKGKRLYPYQKVGAKFLIKKKRALLADEMGLGKTIQVIVACNTLQSKRILVICPAVMRETWAREIRDWSVRKYNPRVLRSAKDTWGPLTDNVLIISYDLAIHKNISAVLKGYDYDTIICDEFHYLKSWKAQRTRSVLGKLWTKAKYRFGLTGTPATKGIIDLHPQFSAFADVGTFKEFAYTYTRPVFNGFGIQYKGFRNKLELRAITKQFMLRRLKRKVLPELPDKILKTIYIDIPKTLAKESLAYVDRAMQQITGIKSDEINHEAVDYVATMKRHLGMAKVKGAVEYIRNIAEQKECVVVFGYHKSVIHTIASALTAKKIDVEVITGDTPIAKRQWIFDAFQDGAVKVLLMNMLAGGVGVTLTRSDHCIVTELDWTPANMSQAIDRLHRIGQKNAVEVDIMIAKNSLDAEIIDALQEKMIISREVLGDVAA